MENSNIKKNMLWNAAGNLIYLFCQWLITILVANIGSFTDAGVLSIAMSVSATFQTVALFGIRNYQNSDIEGKYSDTCYVSFRILSCGAALALCMLFSLVTGYRSNQLLSIFLFMLFRLSENFSDVLHGIAQKNGRLDLAGKSYIFRGIGVLTAFVIIFKLSSSLTIALLTMAIISWLCTVIYDIPVIKKLSSFKLIQRSEKPWSLAKIALPLCAYQFMSNSFLTIAKLILEQQTTEEILGIYSSIFAPALLITSALNYFYAPFVTYFAEVNSKHDTRTFIRTFVKILCVVMAVAVITIIAAIFFGDFALKLLFGEKILAYSYLLIPILISIFASAIFTFLCTICVVLRDFVCLLIACGAGLLSEILLTGKWIELAGINAASYGYTLASCIASTILLFRIMRILFGKHKKGA